MNNKRERCSIDVVRRLKYDGRAGARVCGCDAGRGFAYGMAWTWARIEKD